MSISPLFYLEFPDVEISEETITATTTPEGLETSKMARWFAHGDIPEAPLPFPNK